MLFTKVVHKNGTDVLFFPQYISSKQTAVQNPSMDTLFHKNFEHLEKKAFLKSYLININEDFGLGTVQGPFCIFFFLKLTSFFQGRYC